MKCLEVDDDMATQALKLAFVMKRCPNSIFIGPGSATQWKLHESFDEGADKRMIILRNLGVPQLNVIEQVNKMTMRDKFHFADTPDNRQTLTTMLGIAIDSMSTSYCFGCLRSFSEMYHAHW